MTTLGVRLPGELIKDIEDICSLSKRSKSSIVKEALQKYIEETQDYYTALKRLEDHKKDNYKTYTLEEAAEILGVEDI